MSERERNLADEFMPPSARIGDQEARRLGLVTRPPAPALTAEEARTVARFDAAPVPPEVVAAGERQEAVARAIHDARYIEYVSPDGDASFTEADSRTLAAAAIAALPPSPAELAVKRVEALADQANAAAWIRAALASPAPAPQGEEGQR